MGTEKLTQKICAKENIKVVELNKPGEKMEAAGIEPASAHARPSVLHA